MSGEVGERLGAQHSIAYSWLSGDFAVGPGEEALDGPSLRSAPFLLRSIRLASEHCREGGSWGREAPPGAFGTLPLSLPIQGRAVINRATKRCLEIKKASLDGYLLVLQTCTAQVWTIQYTVRNWGSS